MYKKKVLPLISLWISRRVEHTRATESQLIDHYMSIKCRDGIQTKHRIIFKIDPIFFIYFGLIVLYDITTQLNESQCKFRTKTINDIPVSIVIAKKTIQWTQSDVALLGKYTNKSSMMKIRW